MTPAVARMGYQRGLDGLRALSVVGVLLYHAGFRAFHGGFLGVEVFFVVSGFLITGLLVEEWQRFGSVSLAQFWRRRWRRLLPALFLMLLVVSVWVALAGSLEQRVQMRRDVPWAVLYGANWGQIVGEVPYFAPSPPLLRHVWSLAVEEQWYVVWPLVAMVLLWGVRRRGWRAPRVALGVAGVGVGVMVLTAVLAAVGEWDAGRQNFVYLSTLTRSSGLLLGAGLAFVWRPWRVGEDIAGAGRTLNVAALLAVVAIAAAMWQAEVVDQWTYWWWLPLVSVASAVVVAVVVHPWARGARAVLGWAPLVGLGKRSYGVYVWSWPISRVVGAFEGSVSRFAIAMALTAVVSEASYRFVETPIRDGRWARWRRSLAGRERTRLVFSSSLAGVLLVGSLGVYYRAQPATYDEVVDRTGDTGDFDATAAGVVDGTTPVADPLPTSLPVPTATTVFRDTPGAPRLVVVGDSIADSLVVNAPPGLAKVFRVVNGAARGCSVYSSGYAVTPTGRNSFARCKTWERTWVAPVKKYKAKLALVALGAWDVLDQREAGGATMALGTAEHDARFVAGVQRGINVLSAAGAKVALLEVMCMRPRKFWPERGEDNRVAHINELLRAIAAKNPATTRFIPAPPVFCADPLKPTELRYRGDGVHFYRAGATVVYEYIAKPLQEFLAAKP